jgi:desulfoferrodoxin-like iron-binding protein
MREGKTYVCAICGNEVVFAKDGGGKVICCGQEMTEKEE